MSTAKNLSRGVIDDALSECIVNSKRPIMASDWKTETTGYRGRRSEDYCKPIWLLEEFWLHR